MHKGKVVCDERRCGWRGETHEVLQATSPFDERDILDGCPQCKAVNTIYVACDEEGCWDTVSCGTPTPDGYRSTCSKHAPKRGGNASQP